MKSHEITIFYPFSIPSSRGSACRMDVSFHVLKELKKRPYVGPPIHSVAVDEVQDLAQMLGLGGIF